jgi:hypothetical protein
LRHEIGFTAPRARFLRCCCLAAFCDASLTLSQSDGIFAEAVGAKSAPRLFFARHMAGIFGRHGRVRLFGDDLKRVRGKKPKAARPRDTHIFCILVT